MGTTERPCLRGCQVEPLREGGESFLRIANREGLSDHWLRIPQAYGLVLKQFDGTRDVAGIVAAVQEECEVALPAELVAQLVQELDEIVALDTPRYEAARLRKLDEYRTGGVREPVCAGGVYPNDPDGVRRLLRKGFEDDRGSGLPRGGPPRGGLRAAFAPHIDYRRGGPSFSWAYRAIAERSDAEVFVVVATSHHSGERFTLTRNDFRTPLGLVRTDKDYVDEVARAYGETAAYADELCHLPEHSVELELLLLQYVRPERPFAIVPLLVGPFADTVARRSEPGDEADIALMVAALRAAERNSGKKICYLISGDLAHLGPKFGDPDRVDAPKAKWNRTCDAAFLSALETGRPTKVFAAVAEEQDERRLCGFPPAYTALAAAGETIGKTLFHDQFVCPRGTELVSFASVAFDG